MYQQSKLALSTQTAATKTSLCTVTLPVHPQLFQRHYLAGVAVACLVCSELKIVSVLAHWLLALLSSQTISPAAGWDYAHAQTTPYVPSPMRLIFSKSATDSITGNAGPSFAIVQHCALRCPGWSLRAEWRLERSLPVDPY